MIHQIKFGKKVITEHYFQIGEKFRSGTKIWTVRKNNAMGMIQGVCATEDGNPKSSLITFRSDSITPID